MISRNEVPKYLQNGSFFQALNESDDDEKFEVPSNCLKADLTIKSDQNLSHVLRSIQFWGVYDMPGEILRYAIKSAQKPYLEELVMEFPEFKDYLGKIIALKACKPEQAIPLTIHFQLGEEVAYFLHRQMNCPVLRQQIEDALRSDELDFILFIHAEIKKVQLPNAALVGQQMLTLGVVKHGSMKILRHAQKEGWSFDNDHFLAAVSAGHVEVVKFLREECGRGYTPETMKHANKLELVCYLHETGCPWGDEFALNNLLDCLTFAHEQGCPWSAQTCFNATFGGNLRCLKYAHLQGCPLDQQVWFIALLSGSWKCSWYALNNSAASDPWMNLFKSMSYLVVALAVKLYNRDVEWPYLDSFIKTSVFHLLYDVLVLTKLLQVKKLFDIIEHKFRLLDE